MSRGTPDDPELQWQSGLPFSGRFGDVYFDRERGREESETVFLGGCDLPGAWSDRPCYVIAETGFGTGLNFLVTWDAWRRHRKPGQRLHFLSVEGFPLTTTDLLRAAKPYPELARLYQQLAERYPVTTRGYHRVFFDDDKVCLTLLIGEVADMLEQLEATVDAWFLDGFAPARNPGMWRPEVLRQIARLSRPGARLATFTAAGAVRRGLTEVGFDMTRAPGFGSKRERLLGRFTGTPESGCPAWFKPPPAADSGEPVTVLGNGIGGCAVSRALERRGHPHRWLGHGAGASSNPAANVMPRFEAGPGAAGRFLWAAYRFALGFWQETGDAWRPAGSLALARDASDLQRQQRVHEYWQMPASTMIQLSAGEASDAAGVSLRRSGLWYPESGLVDGSRLAGLIAPQFEEARPTGLARSEEGWLLSGAELLEPSRHLVLATGVQGLGSRWSGLPLQAWWGQTLNLPSGPASDRLKCTLVAGRYLTPSRNGHHLAGASFHRGSDPADDHQALHRQVTEAFPELVDLGPPQSSWSGIRCATPDRLPAVGPLPDWEEFDRRFGWLRHGPARGIDVPDPPHDQLFALTGLGARGFTTAPLCGEWLVSLITGDPWPLERDLALAVHASRFAVRDLRRGRR
ncbi:MAG: bifunctional tRNA (5-methylaminomethyl-2-thiouridine)(34)-methyltransferase MnmD/FAD-dependent 5-carboxymethylaminomethyl-2-thiouridine(34) oxidoreductase MnmC [Xanthomonadales bacterium]|nr:bifunctional tRNA (5-methylaminomethyl-2-thiouridine)(34)-methyltransferase MnmD/FAD-dependent 5-carboxymethylaminomethyl-2-thiouridine(34) oxidoreductase MnmC [Xanthomonadales bacterium]